MSDNSDSDNGFNKVPGRYAGGGREVVDQWRDTALKWADRVRLGIAQCDPEFPDEARHFVANLLFAYACETHATKYEQRAGAKGDPEGDMAKFNFYNDMWGSVLYPGLVADPRSGRPDFVPYRYPED